MKRLLTICAVVGLILSTTCISWAVPMVSSPPEAPSWWNAECDYYAYANWGSLTPGDINVSPLPGMTFWASNFLINTDFKASAVGTTVSIDLKNGERENLDKEIFILIHGNKQR